MAASNQFGSCAYIQVRVTGCTYCTVCKAKAKVNKPKHKKGPVKGGERKKKVSHTKQTSEREKKKGQPRSSKTPGEETPAKTRPTLIFFFFLTLCISNGQC